MSLVFRIVMLVGLIGLMGNLVFVAFFNVRGLDANNEDFINPVSIISSVLFLAGLLGLVMQKIII